MTKRRYDPEAARDDILDAAERLFAGKGFDGVSTAAIAKEAGVSQSQIHYHFDTKQKLWDQVMGRRFADYFAAQSLLLDDQQTDELARLRDSIASYWRFFEKYPNYVKLLSRADLDRAPTVRPEDEGPAEEMADELMVRGAEIIAAAQRSGAIRDDVRPEFVILGFLSLVAHWFHTGRHIMPDRHDVAADHHQQEYLDFITRVYLRGIAP
ncbi:MAG: TetR/AcrR family transcriptional regulator [Myxococcota bacterium]